MVICPSESVSPLDAVELNPAPATSTCEIVTSEPPAFVRIMCCVLLLAMLTLPKFKLLVLELSTRVPVFDTVNDAGLLVTLPVLFLTTTVNCAPLSEALVAGVV